MEKPVRIPVYAVYFEDERISNFFLLEKSAVKERFQHILKYKTPVIRQSIMPVTESTTRRMM